MPKGQARGGYTLRDSPFFRLRSRKELAELLRVSPGTLAAIAASENLYKRRWKHKTRDQWVKVEPEGEIGREYRPIDIPDPRLKSMQSRVSELLCRISAPDFLFSPVRGRSYVDNAAEHLDAQAFWLLDVADYFQNCTANNVARFFRHELECSPDVTAILVRLTTWNGSLPQGSPCSPILAYFSNRPMWTQVAEIVHEAGCKITVYADDITISGGIIRKAMIWNVKKIIHGHGLRLKESKEVSIVYAPADITGVIVFNGKTRLPNRQLKKLADLKSLRKLTRSPRLRRQLEDQISGRIAQRKQVER